MDDLKIHHFGIVVKSIDDYLEEFAESCVQIREATEILYNGLCGIPFVQPYPSQGNYVFCKVLHGYTSENLVAALYADSGILINDCTIRISNQVQIEFYE